MNGFGAQLPTCTNPDIDTLCEPTVSGFADLPIGSVPTILADVTGGPIAGPFGGMFTAWGPQVDLVVTNTSPCIIQLQFDLQSPAVFATLPVGAFAQAAVLFNFGTGSSPTPISGPGTFFSQSGFMGQENTGTFVQRHLVGPGAGSQFAFFPFSLAPGDSIFLSFRLAVDVTGIAGGSVVFVGGPEVRVVGLNDGAP